MSVQEQVAQGVRLLSDERAKLLLELLQWLQPCGTNEQLDKLGIPDVPDECDVVSEEIAAQRLHYLARMDAQLKPSGRTAEEISQYIRDSRDDERFS